MTGSLVTAACYQACLLGLQRGRRSEGLDLQIDLYPVVVLQNETRRVEASPHVGIIIDQTAITPLASPRSANGNAEQAGYVSARPAPAVQRLEQ